MNHFEANARAEAELAGYEARAARQPHRAEHNKPNVTRFEVIDHRPNSTERGRVFQAHELTGITLSYQDEGRTLKVFVT